MIHTYKHVCLPLQRCILYVSRTTNPATQARLNMACLLLQMLDILLIYHILSHLVCGTQDTTCRCRKSKGKGTSCQGLQLPDVDTVLPLEAALQSLPDQPPAAVKAVYRHWCQKRQGSERPLLQRLWYEPPWHRLTVAGNLMPHSLIAKVLHIRLSGHLGSHDLSRHPTQLLSGVCMLDCSYCSMAVCFIRS